MDIYMRYDIYCLFTKGDQPDNACAKKLNEIARRMKRSKSKKRAFELPDGKATVYTKYATAIVGAISGVIFWADISRPTGNDSYIRFLITHHDLSDEQVARMEFGSVPVEAIFGSESTSHNN